MFQIFYGVVSRDTPILKSAVCYWDACFYTKVAHFLAYDSGHVSDIINESLGKLCTQESSKMP